MAGNCSVETCGQIFASSARQASSNYGVGTDGRVALYVDEANRSWCTSSNANDQRAVTIEVANNGGAPDWPVSDKAYAALLDLVTDICKRNGIKKLVWSTSKNDRVNHLNGCNMTAAQMGNLEYSIVLQEDGTVTFVMAGSDIPGLTWAYGRIPTEAGEADGIVIDYYTQALNLVPTEKGFDMDYFGSMLMHFAPEDSAQ